MGIKKLIINSGTIACLLFGKLSKTTITTLVIGRFVNSKSFWRYIKLVYSDKGSNSNMITQLEKDLILKKNDDISETFNDFFTSVVSNSNIPRYHDPFVDSDQTENQIGHPILRMIEKYKNHPSIIAINPSRPVHFEKFY